MGCKFVWHENRVALSIGDCPVPQRSGIVLKCLNRLVGEIYLAKVLAAKDQGRSFHLLSNNQLNNFWIRTGKYLSFSEYRFAFKARLNLLPTKTVVRRTGKRLPDVLCPVCKNQDDTLAHNLNNCISRSDLIRNRHNSILRRLEKAIPRAPNRQIFVDQTIPNVSGILRPDLVVKQENSYIVCDVTIPFESGDDAYDNEDRYFALSIYY